MSNPNPTDISAFGKLPDEVESVCKTFESEWQPNQIHNLSIYLSRVSTAHQNLTLRELACRDLERHYQQEHCLPVEKYFKIYPQLQTDKEAALQLIKTEYDFRKRQDPGLSKTEYLKRFSQFRSDLEKLLPERTKSVSSQPEIPGYEILAQLGRGGMGVVYKARQIKADRIVALKMILAGVNATQEEKNRFEDEVKAAARLQHPNIVQIFEVGESNGNLFYSLEFCPQGSLKDKLKDQILRPREAAVLVKELAKAIHSAHQEAKIVHRDLTPGNVLFDKDDVPKIGDFGLVKKLGVPGQTQPDAVLGTPGYMAPEQIGHRKKTVGPPADVYALGAILYKCLTGRPPFLAVTIPELMQLIHDYELTPPSKHNKEIPRDLETICLKCLQEDASQRYETAQELADDLQRHLSGEPIRARRTPLAQRVFMWCRKRPLLTAQILTVAVVCVLLVGLFLYYLRVQVLEAQRIADVSQRANVILKDAEAWRDKENWQQTRLSAERAEELLKEIGDRVLQTRLNTVLADLRMVSALDKARLSQLNIKEGQLDMAGADIAYARAFADYGMDVENGTIDSIAPKLRSRVIKKHLIAALYDWSMVTRENDTRAHLVAVISKIDESPLRKKIRDAVFKRDCAALKRHAETIDISQHPAHFLEMLGLALAETSDLLNAIHFFKKVVVRYPSDVMINHHLGSLNRRLGSEHLDEAIGFYRSARALRSDSPGVHLNLGAALHEKGEYDDAIRVTQEALRLDPKYAEAYENIGHSYKKKGDLQKAGNAYKSAVDVNPKFASGYYHLGLIYMEKQDLGQAAIFFRNAHDLKPNDSDYRHNLKTAYYNHANKLRLEQRLAEAIRAYQEAIKVDPNYLEAHGNLGLTYQQMGQFRKGLTALQASLNLLGPNDPRRAQSLAWIRECRRLMDLDEKLAALLLTGKYTEKQFQGNLTDQATQKNYDVKLIGGKTYVIDMKSKQFDSFLRLDDSNGRKLAEDDDSGGGLNSRIVFTAKQDQTGRIVATSFQQGGRGEFWLTIRGMVQHKVTLCTTKWAWFNPG